MARWEAVTDVLDHPLDDARRRPPTAADAPVGLDLDHAGRRRTAGGAASRTGSGPSASPRSWWWPACVLYTLAQLHPDLILKNTTPAGGDMGAHVWGPAYLRDHILPHFWLIGLGARLVRRLPDVPLLHGAARRWRWWCSTSCCPYGVALKLVSVVGILSLPVCAWPSASWPASGSRCRQLFAIAAVVLPVRRDLPDLRRQHRLDDGGRVLVLDRAVAGAALPRRLRLRDAHRQAPRPGRRALRPGRAVPRHRHVLRRHRRRRALPAVGGQEAALVRRLRRRRRRRCCARSGTSRSGATRRT